MKTITLLMIIFAVFSSCKKKEVEPTICESSVQEFEVPNTKGSYWKYQCYRVDTSGVETLYGEPDSVYVYGDTVISNKRYTVIKGTWLTAPSTTILSIRRDSSGFIVNENGKVIYSFNNFTDTLRTGSLQYGPPPESWHWYMKMYNNISINVPAGTFNTVEARRSFYDPNGGPANNCGDAEFTLGYWYADGIGKVKETNGFIVDLQNCGAHLEARLTDYYIAP